MWRDKKTKKPVYMEVIDKYDIDKNADGVTIFGTDQFYNCESWDRHINILKLEELAEWVDEDVEV